MIREWGIWGDRAIAFSYDLLCTRRSVLDNLSGEVSK